MVSPGRACQCLSARNFIFVAIGSGVTIGPADPTLQGGAVIGGHQNSTLASADGNKS